MPTTAPDYYLVPDRRLDEFVEVESRRRDLGAHYDELPASERDELSSLDSRDSVDRPVFVCAECGRIFIGGEHGMWVYEAVGKGRLPASRGDV